MFERATDAVLALPPGMAPCRAMPATCWPHGRHGAAGLLSRAGAALTALAQRQTGVLEDAARRRQHSTQDDAERRRATHPSCRSSSTIIIESGQTRRRWPRGTGSAGHTRCPRGVQERLWRRRRGGCGAGGGVGEVASRRMLARWGELGACASGRAARRPSEGLRVGCVE
mmetsp:Transcript_74770/g.206232  ORF Transcript_74770/g.206232 Transcript_74770/m.206232 type:complete len:170 (+) Transcript_74770:30-539(+)